MFRRLLVANRGEIALRVIRTAREMGIETVAVYSAADETALHRRFADVAVPLGGALPSQSYLDMDKLLDAAARAGADAVHPGYGFLSENAKFAQRVADAGLVWVGPPPAAIAAMGDKIQSRRLMLEAGVPLVPGLTEPVEDARAALREAESIGYPIAIKAAAGGGGKGIRIVSEPDEMASAFRTASGEARASFGDGRLYLERYLSRPHHVEVQVMFDRHGHGVHLFERECSVQRRHQKLIEETPSPIVDAALRERMGAAALRAASAVGYEGAGTVEFLASDASGELEFFFLEMNTRLQVEHPVTEMVTGRDLVRDQLRVAAGEALGYAQGDVVARGHAIEVRINAEDGSAGFVPSIGTVRNLRLPSGPWVRVDSGLYRGMQVGLEYDPLLAKVIVWGEDRDAALARMRRALQELGVGGVRTTAPAALRVLSDPRFVAGDYDTHLLDGIDLSTPAEYEHGEELAATVAAALFRWHASRRRALSGGIAERAAWRDRGRTSFTRFTPRGEADR